MLSRARNAQRYQQIKWLRDRGATHVAIAAEVGVTRQAVGNILKRAGAPMKFRVCTVCLRRMSKKRVYSYHRSCARVSLACDWCGTLFSKPLSDLWNQNYCNDRCRKAAHRAKAIKHMGRPRKEGAGWRR
jgi:hypothetical protein